MSTDMFGQAKSKKMTQEEFRELQKYMPPISPAPIVDSSGRPVLDASGKPMMTPPDQIVLSPEDQTHRIEIAMIRKENRERYQEQKKRDEAQRQQLEAVEKARKERHERQIAISKKINSLEYMYQQFLSGSFDPCPRCHWSRVSLIVCNKPTCPMSELGKDLKPLLNHLREIIKSSIQVNEATMNRLASFFNEDEKKKNNYHAVINRLLDMAEAKK